MVEGASYPNQIVDTQIEDSIDAQLAAKGLTKVIGGDKADLYVAYQVSGKAVERVRHGRRSALGWRNGQRPKLDHQYRNSGPRYVRPPRLNNWFGPDA
jgi:hypothetical protein